MRRLTRVEVAVVRDLLAGPGASVSDRMRELGIPRRTYQTARRRVRLRGWVQERWLPEPVRLGFGRVSFALAHPYLESGADLVAAWRTVPGIVCLWSTPETVFAVRFESGEAPLERWPCTDATKVRELFVLPVDLAARTVPIFFDFEGAWDRLTGSGLSRDYPRALPRCGSGPPATADAARLRRGQLGDLLEPTVSDADDDGFLGQALVRRRRERARRSGWLERRAFLDPTAVQTSSEELVERFAFVHALLRPEADPTLLLQELRIRSGIAPFLYASDGKALLLGVLSTSSLPPRSDGVPRETPLEILRRSATGIVTVREPARGLERPIDYRFERLVDLEADDGAPLDGADAEPAPRADRRSSGTD